MFEALLQLEALMEARKPARLTFPDGSYVTGQVAELNVPGGSDEYARPSVVLHAHAGPGFGRYGVIQHVVLELREDALPSVEAAEQTVPITRYSVVPDWDACGMTCFVTTGPMGPTWCVTHARWFNPPAHSPLSEDCTVPVAAVAAPGDDRLAARKKAEAKIEVVLEQLDTDEQLALLFRILRARGWSTDRADTVLAKARWNG